MIREVTYYGGYSRAHIRRAGDQPDITLYHQRLTLKEQP